MQTDTSRYTSELPLSRPRAWAIALSALAALAIACEDPAKSATKAVTTEAVAAPVTSAPAPQATRTYAFDSDGSSRIAWVGSKVTGKHDGGFDRFKGTATVVDGDPTRSRVEVEIDATSLTSDTEKLTGHLKSADFFDTERFPKITFASTKIERGGDKGTHTVTGNLTMHGVTKGVSFPATVKLEGDAVSVDADFAINRRDFEVNYKGAPNDLIRDDVVVKLAIRATAS
jgi:polyisoprenoid-binding protein YceI